MIKKHIYGLLLTILLMTATVGSILDKGKNIIYYVFVIFFSSYLCIFTLMKCVLSKITRK